MAILQRKVLELFTDIQSSIVQILKVVLQNKIITFLNIIIHKVYFHQSSLIHRIFCFLQNYCISYRLLFIFIYFLGKFSQVKKNHKKDDILTEFGRFFICRTVLFYFSVTSWVDENKKAKNLGKSGNQDTKQTRAEPEQSIQKSPKPIEVIWENGCAYENIVFQQKLL